jgi:hypothetical protein
MLREQFVSIFRVLADVNRSGNRHAFNVGGPTSNLPLISNFNFSFILYSLVNCGKWFGTFSHFCTLKSGEKRGNVKERLEKHRKKINCLAEGDIQQKTEILMFCV